MRYRAKDGKTERVASLERIRRINGTFGVWFGLGPGDAPMVLRNTGNLQTYALDWETP